MTTPTGPNQSSSALSTVTLDLQAELAPPALQLPSVEDLIGVAGAVEQGQSAEVLPVREQVVEGGSEGGEPRCRRR